MTDAKKTKKNNTESSWITLHQGVDQGTLLEPLNFNLYINDLNKQLTNSFKLVQYADDRIFF